MQMKSLKRAPLPYSHRVKVYVKNVAHPLRRHNTRPEATLTATHATQLTTSRLACLTALHLPRAFSIHTLTALRTAPQKNRPSESVTDRVSVLIPKRSQSVNCVRRLIRSIHAPNSRSFQAAQLIDRDVKRAHVRASANCMKILQSWPPKSVNTASAE